MMPSYFEVWKKRMNNNGGSVSQSILNNSKKIFTGNFKDDPSYRQGILRKSDLTEISIDTRIINIDKSTSEKRIQILPDNVCSLGDYIVYKDKVYIVVEFEDNSVVPYAKVRECMQTLNLKGWNNPQPCWGTNSSYGVKGEIDTNFFTIVDGKIQFKVQKNKYTDMMQKGTRFMFNNNKRYIYKVVECENILNNGIYTITVDKDVTYSEKDDEVNNIAYNEYLETETPINPNPTPADSYNIIADSGDLSLKRYNVNTFRVVDSYGNNVSNTWVITVDYNGVPESNITIKEIGTNYIKLVNNKGYNELSIKIKFEYDETLLVQEVRLIN